MNKLNKIGLSALCGSLASIGAANAGSIDVTGSSEATWTSLSGQVTGNPIGMKTNLSFTGNGELDGGQTFSVLVAYKDKLAGYSSSNITLNTNSGGTFKLSSAEGGQGIGGYDDNMPTAWEEVWDTGIATNANFQKGVGSSTNLSWTSPAVANTTLQVAYSPQNDGSQNADKAVSGVNDAFGAGWDVVLDINKGGALNLFVGASETEQSDQKKSDQSLKDLGGDHQEAVVGLQFSFGPIKVGGQVSAERLRTQSYNAPQYYGNSSWGIAFNVNDSLSVSYGQARHLQVKTKKSGNGITTGQAKSGSPRSNEAPKSWMRGNSIQATYTFGGIGLKYARTKYDNTAFTFDAKIPRDSQLVAVSLAF
jgi:hypothetical protein